MAGSRSMDSCPQMFRVLGPRATGIRYIMLHDNNTYSGTSVTNSQ